MIANAFLWQIFIKAKPRRETQKARLEEKAIYALDYFFATEPAGKVNHLNIFLTFSSLIFFINIVSVREMANGCCLSS